MNNKILEALKWRYAVQTFDFTKKVSAENIHTIVESARLAPSSIGLEAWKFIVIENSDVRAKLRVAGYDQSKITEASHLVVITGRTDIEENITRERLERTAKTQGNSIESLEGLGNMIKDSIDAHKSRGDLSFWIKAQSYIALGMMMETASLLGVDNAAMEGFDVAKVDEVLGLTEKKLTSVTMLALGYRGVDPVAERPKTRRSFDEVIEFIK
jgi:nitroreductase/dihydropteridine reductase